MSQEESKEIGKIIGLMGPLPKLDYYFSTPFPYPKRCAKRKGKENKTKGPHHGKSELCIPQLHGLSVNKVAKEKSFWGRLLF